MRYVCLLVVMLISQLGSAQEADVKKAIETFFDGFHKRDTIIMKSVFADGIVLHSVAEKKDGAVFSQESAAELCKSIAAIPKDFKFEEKLLSYNIQIDGSMAHVWTPYDFFTGGKLSHSGVNSFQLFKDKKGWKITYCIDTRRKSL